MILHKVTSPSDPELRGPKPIPHSLRGGRLHTGARSPRSPQRMIQSAPADYTPPSRTRPQPAKVKIYKKNPPSNVYKKSKAGLAIHPPHCSGDGGILSWLCHATSNQQHNITMISGCITPAIMQEALRRTPNHKAAGPDGVPSLILNHMPPEFHAALQLLFHAMSIMGITPPSWLHSHTILLYK